MARYELTTIVADESATTSAVTVISKHGGSIIREEELGKRRFAYPIEKLTNGVYTRVTFEAEPAAVHAIDDALRHDTGVLRHLIVVQHVEPQAPAAPIDDAAIEALGDVKEMTKQAETAKKARAKTEDEASEPATEEPVGEAAATAETTTAEQPTKQAAAEETTETMTSAVKDESVVDEATRQAALDEKLKNILGK